MTGAKQLAVTLLLATTLVAPAMAQESQAILKVWPGKPPNESGDFGPEKTLDGRSKDTKTVTRVTNVTESTLRIMRPTKEKDTGAAVVVAPGGGYSILAYNLEGTEVAEWLNSIGVSAFVFKYRVPRRPDQPKDLPPLQPLQDAQRAIRLVRSRAPEMGIDPKKIGMLGFSAGGNLTVRTSTQFESKTYEPIDKIDEISPRPDFAILIYPAYCAPKNEVKLAEGLSVPKNSPPMFFAHAIDDNYGPENSMAVFFELKKHKIPAELHVYSGGGHGFGLRPSKKTSAQWPTHCEAWLKAAGLLSK